MPIRHLKPHICPFLSFFREVYLVTQGNGNDSIRISVIISSKVVCGEYISKVDLILIFGFHARGRYAYKMAKILKFGLFNILRVVYMVKALSVLIRP